MRVSSKSLTFLLHMVILTCRTINSLPHNISNQNPNPQNDTDKNQDDTNPQLRGAITIPNNHQTTRNLQAMVGLPCTSLGSCSSRYCRAGRCRRCVSDNNCEPDHVCRSGNCVSINREIRCTGNAECLPNHVCLFGFCRPDFYAPNCVNNNFPSGLQNGCRCSNDVECSSRYCIGLTCVAVPPSCGSQPYIPNGCRCVNDAACASNFCTKPTANNVGYCSSFCTDNAQCPPPSQGCDFAKNRVCLPSGCTPTNKDVGCSCNPNVLGQCNSGLYCNSITSTCAQCPATGTIPIGCSCGLLNQICTSGAYCEESSNTCSICPTNNNRPRNCPCDRNDQCAGELECDLTCQPFIGNCVRSMYQPCSLGGSGLDCCEKDANDQKMECGIVRGQYMCINP